jgi:hypothetical protein
MQSPPLIPFNDLNKRTELFTALFNDELPSVEPAVKKALPATSLKPLADAAVIVGNVHTYELAATGADEKTANSCKMIAQRAADLIDLAMEKNANQITLINQSANIVVNYQETTFDQLAGRAVIRNRQKRNGLSQKDSATLTTIVNEAEASINAITEFTNRLRSGDLMNKTSLSCAKISAAAKSVLTADYGPFR